MGIAGYADANAKQSHWDISRRGGRADLCTLEKGTKDGVMSAAEYRMWLSFQTGKARVSLDHGFFARLILVAKTVIGVLSGSIFARHSLFLCPARI